MHKLLADIALPITEEEYRNDGCLHYSTLATYERGGFAAIPTLGEKKESESLLFGSLVDTLLTGSTKEFQDRFFVVECEKPKPSEITVVRALYDKYHIAYNAMAKIPDADLLTTINEVGYGKGWLDKTKLTNIRKCSEYYNLLILAESKDIIDTEMYQDAINAVAALRESDATRWYFEKDNPFDDSIEHLYQGKFKATFDGLDYSCMADLLVCDHKNKIIYPCDLKTSSHMEYEFYKSFLDWSYSIQSGQYAAILKANIEKDEYFKDFKIMPYRFIVVNRKSLNPLVWEWPYTFSDVDIEIKTSKGYPIILRNFKNIGKELSHYLETQQSVPDGISFTNTNNIEKWIEKM